MAGVTGHPSQGHCQVRHQKGQWLGPRAVFAKCLPCARCCSSSVETAVSKTVACVGLGKGEEGGRKAGRQTTNKSRKEKNRISRACGKS